MGYCTKCGAELKENQNFCVQCGKPVSDAVSNVSTSLNDDGGFGWALLGFCIPIVGLVLFLVWQNEKPLTASAAGKGALVSVIFSVVMYVILVIVLAASGAFLGTGY